jgi:uncharacterized protein YbaR (Trm112 family)
MVGNGVNNNQDSDQINSAVSISDAIFIKTKVVLSNPQSLNRDSAHHLNCKTQKVAYEIRTESPSFLSKPQRSNNKDMQEQKRAQFASRLSLHHMLDLWNRLGSTRFQLNGYEETIMERLPRK